MGVRIKLRKGHRSEIISPMDELITIEFDGGSRGNPGPAGIGVVLRAQDGTPLITLGRFIGRATNNVAEYKALITGLQKAKELGAKKLLIRGDSELIVKQMRGEYRVKNLDLRDPNDEAAHLYHEFDEAKIEHNYPDKNPLEDRLASLAMDRNADLTDSEDSLLAPPAHIDPKLGHRFICPRSVCLNENLQPSRIRTHLLRPYNWHDGGTM